MGILCLGEAIADLICERELDSPADADQFRPHFGGALANVAVAARRHGAATALAGGVGDDPMGRWLRDRLVAEGVDLRWFNVLPGVQTPLALTTFDATREPSFQIYGDGLEAGFESIANRISEAVRSSSALLFGSNTLVEKADRDLTLRARAEALDGGIPILFDPNLRPGRWDDLDRALQRSREVCDGAFVVRTNLSEARWLTGSNSSDPGQLGGLGSSGPEQLSAPGSTDRGQLGGLGLSVPERLAGTGFVEAGRLAAELCELGAEIGVVTLGVGGAVMRGRAEADAPAGRIDLVSPLGAGDAFFGTLAAGLAELNWDPGLASRALPAAVTAGTRACLGWGAHG